MSVLDLRIDLRMFLLHLESDNFKKMITKIITEIVISTFLPEKNVYTFHTVHTFLCVLTRLHVQIIDKMLKLHKNNVITSDNNI